LVRIQVPHPNFKGVVVTAKNDITGDSIRSKTSNQKLYAENWDKIFGNNKKTTKKKRKRGRVVDGSSLENWRG